MGTDVYLVVNHKDKSVFRCSTNQEVSEHIEAIVENSWSYDVEDFMVIKTEEYHYDILTLEKRQAIRVSVGGR